MEAPPSICRALAEINPSARLAWVGEKPSYEGELNPGSFALVKLYRSRDVGPLDNVLIPNELWATTIRPDKFGKAQRVRIDRGTLFDRKGGMTMDYDPVEWVPVYMAKLKDYGLSNEAVAAGAVVPLARRWQMSIEERYKQSVRQAGRDLKSKVDDLSRKATDFLWHKASKSDQTTPLTTREERVAAHAKLETRRADFEKYYDGTKVFR